MDARKWLALVMVTGVSTVRLDFGLATERTVEEFTVTEARRHLADGQFPPGSMGPKIEAAIKFVDGQVAGECDRVAAITTPELVYGTLDISSHGIIEGGRGTRINADPVLSSAPAKELTR